MWKGFYGIWVASSAVNMLVCFSGILPSLSAILWARHSSADSAAEDAGVLLWQHELHEVIPQNSIALLQEWVALLRQGTVFNPPLCGSSRWCDHRAGYSEVVQWFASAKGEERVPERDETHGGLAANSRRRVRLRNCNCSSRFLVTSVYIYAFNHFVYAMPCSFMFKGQRLWMEPLALCACVIYEWLAAKLQLGLFCNWQRPSKSWFWAANWAWKLSWKPWVFAWDTMRAYFSTGSGWRLVFKAQFSSSRPGTVCKASCTCSSGQQQQWKSCASEVHEKALQ